MVLMLNGYEVCAIPLTFHTNWTSVCPRQSFLRVLWEKSDRNWC